MLGIYIRKSRDSAKEKSLKEQKLLGQEFALENKMEYAFFDEGIISGQKKKEQRPKFAELFTAIERKEITGVYIWDSSRIARNERAWLDFADLLKETGVLLYDNGVKADFTDENTYLFYYMKSGFDAHFAKITAKKIKTVLNRNAREGRPHGLLPYGYTTNKKGKWKKHKKEVNTVKLIFELYQNGYGYIRIANHLNEMGIDTRYDIVWTPATIRYIIYNRTYSGTAKFNEIEIKVPPIIDKKTHEKLLASIGNRYKKPGAKSKRFILNEVMVCGKCGTRYTISQRHRHSYYRCLSEVNRGVPKCHSKAVRAEHLDKLILEYILFGRELYEMARQTYLEGGNVEQKRQLEKKLSYNEKKLDKLKEELKRNHQVYVLGAVELDLYMLEKKRIDRQIFHVDEIIAHLKDDLTNIQHSNRVLEELDVDFDFKLPEIWQDETNDIMRAWKKHAIKEALINNRVDRNKERMYKTMTFEEKCAMVEKYIKKITINYPQVPLKIKIEFNIPVQPMELIMESRYYGAKNLTTNKIHILKDFGKRPSFIYQRMKDEFNSYLDN